jgi:hypothetical protein
MKRFSILLLFFSLFLIDSNAQKRVSFDVFGSLGIAGFAKESDNTSFQDIRLDNFRKGMDAQIGLSSRLRLDAKDRFAVRLGLAYNYSAFNFERYRKYYDDFQSAYTWESTNTISYQLNNILIPLTIEARLGKFNLGLGMIQTFHLGGSIEDRLKGRGLSPTEEYFEVASDFKINEIVDHGFGDSTEYYFEKDEQLQYLIQMSYLISDRWAVGIQYQDYFNLNGNQLVEKIINYDVINPRLEEISYQSGTLSLSCYFKIY